MRIAILMPTKGRAAQMYTRVNALLLQDIPDGVELMVVLAYCEDDDYTRMALNNLAGLWYESDITIVLVKRPSDSTAVDGWNRAYNTVKDVADWFVLGADDIIWHDGWLAEAAKLINNSDAQVIGLNDGQTDLNQYGPHYMGHHDFTEGVLGGHMVPPVYKSWWFDREICEIARERGLYAPGWEIMAEHTHPDWKTAIMDETYSDAWPTHDQDRETYYSRRKVTA